MAANPLKPFKALLSKLIFSLDFIFFNPQLVFRFVNLRLDLFYIDWVHILLCTQLTFKYGI